MMTEIGGIMNFLMVIGDLWGFWPSKMGMCVCVYLKTVRIPPGQSNIEMENPGFFLRLPFIDI